MSKPVELLINVALFQIGWFTAVVSAAKLVPAVGALAIGVVVAVHLYRSARPAAELSLVLMCAAIGVSFDSLLVAAGWVAYPSGQWLPGFAPYWIAAMWMSFATTLNVSLRWMRRRPPVAALFGLIGAPLAYYTGERLGGIELVDFGAAMLALGLGWSLLMPLLSLLSERYDGRSSLAAAQPLSD